MTDVLVMTPASDLEMWQLERRAAAVVELTDIIEQADTPAEAAAMVIEALEDMGWAQDD